MQNYFQSGCTILHFHWQWMSVPVVHLPAHTCDVMCCWICSLKRPCKSLPLYCWTVCFIEFWEYFLKMYFGYKSFATLWQNYCNDSVIRSVCLLFHRMSPKLSLPRKRVSVYVGVYVWGWEGKKGGYYGKKKNPT